MSVGINTYASPEIAQSDIALPATLTTSEVDLFVLTDQRHLHKSQLTIYGSAVNSGVTTFNFNYYYGINTSTTPTPSWLWYPITLYATATGVMSQRIIVLSSGSHTTSDTLSWDFTDNIPLGAAFAFKITGKIASNTGTTTCAYTLKVESRDN